MKNLKFIISIIFVCSIMIAKSQNTGVVIGVIPIGNVSYAIINSDINTYYKTSTFSNNELIVNQNVKLLSVNETEVEVMASTINNTIYGFLQVTNSENNLTLPFSSPKLENGILFFDNLTHLDNTYEYISDYIRIGDYDSLLAELESEYAGFISYRKMIIDKYNWLDGYLTEREINNLYKEDFIIDEVYKSVINSNREIGIGDSIFFMFNDKTILRIHRKDIESLQKIRERKDVENIFLTPLVVNPNITVLLSSIDKDNENNGNDVIFTTEIVSYMDFSTNPHRMRYYTIPEESPTNFCTPFIKKIRVNFGAEALFYSTDPNGNEVIYYTADVLNNPTYMQNFIQNGATLTVDWGDNTAPETIYHYNGWEYVYHTYSANNDYPIKTNFKFTDQLGNQITLIDDPAIDSTNGITITVGNQCVKYERNKQHEKYSSDGDWMFKSKIWTKNNSICRQIGSYSHAYKWNTKKNKWKLSRIKDIHTYVYGMYRHDNCSVDSPKSDSNQKHNAKKVQITKSRAFWHYYSTTASDLYSHHYYFELNTNSQIRDTIVLNLCE